MAAVINTYNRTVTTSLARVGPRVVARRAGTPDQALITSRRDTRITDA